MSVDRTASVLEAIEHALGDATVSGDAMRWSPEGIVVPDVVEVRMAGGHHDGEICKVPAYRSGWGFAPPSYNLPGPLPALEVIADPRRVRMMPDFNIIQYRNAFARDYDGRVIFTAPKVTIKQAATWFAAEIGEPADVFAQGIWPELAHQGACGVVGAPRFTEHASTARIHVECLIWGRWGS